MAPIENGFRLVLAAVDDGLAKAWTRYCGKLPGVEIHRGSILDVQCDAMVSPANSFGFMDGGVDALYVQRFGRHLPLRVRDQILEHHGGELLVGEADIVETGDNDVPFLICAPTMRVPMVLGETVSPYLAARAILRLVRHGSFRGTPFPGVAIRDLVGVVAMPGLGTGIGGVSPVFAPGRSGPRSRTLSWAASRCPAPQPRRSSSIAACIRRSLRGCPKAQPARFAGDC